MTKNNQDQIIGEIVRITGPLVIAEGMKGSKMNDVVLVGEEELTGEIIELNGDQASVQVYEETAGIEPGAPVKSTGSPLSVELGPGMVSNFFDGIQRPLTKLEEESGAFIDRGITASALDREKKWKFSPEVEEGDTVKGGDVLGIVPETPLVDHKILAPSEIDEAKVQEIKEGEHTVEETIAVLKNEEDEKEVDMVVEWPVRKQRSIKNKKTPKEPLVTGQRVFDTFFPITKGGTAAIPGGFGTGKTVSQHQLAKWADADIVVYVGCGERGNEMTEVLEDFPELEDPRSGRPLMERTVLIANTSNMPVAARESSIYTGITIAEYFRDMGYDVALMADSTSRWAEALREISGRLEEMPGEQGYPAYLASRVADFYERAGKVITKGSENQEGSVSVIGAVSPPGGDFSDPVVQNTLKVVKIFWALDSDLADRRHFPSVDWLQSYSLHVDQVKDWWSEEVDDEWYNLRKDAMRLLEKEDDLQDVVQIVGPDALPDDERLELETARMIREDFLQQNAYHDVDTYCPPEKQAEMLRNILHFHDEGMSAIQEGTPIDEIQDMDIIEDIARMKIMDNEEIEDIKQIKDNIKEEFEKVRE